jgi:hypothetical protein
VGCTRERDGGGGLGFEEKDNGDGTQCHQQQLMRKHKISTMQIIE